MRHYKIVVIGKGKSGKSTFINTMVPGDLPAQWRRRTLEVDYGQVVVDGGMYCFFGTPHRRRLRTEKDMPLIFSHAALVIFDGSGPLDRNDREILDDVFSLNIPFFALINERRGRPVETGPDDIKGLCMTCPNFMGVVKGDASNYGFAHRVLYEIRQFICRCHAA